MADTVEEKITEYMAANLFVLKQEKVTAIKILAFFLFIAAVALETSPALLFFYCRPLLRIVYNVCHFCFLFL